MIVIFLAITARVDVDIGADIGVFCRFVQSETLSLEALSIDRASLEVGADVLSGCDCELEVDFSNRANLKNAWIRYKPIEYFSIRIGRQKLPASLEELGSYFNRSYLEHTWGNEWADDADYVGRGLGVRLMGKLPVAKNTRLRLFSGLFSSPSGGWGRFLSRLIVEYEDNHIAAGYSSQNGFFQADSVLLMADFHLDLPVSLDGEILIGPGMRAYWIGVRTSLFKKRLQPAIRYQWIDAPSNYSVEIEDLSFGLSGVFAKHLRIQVELSLPLIPQTTPLRLFSAIKIHF